MPTRADLYVGEGPGAQWLGSYRFDGHPAELDKSILRSTSEQEYRDAVFRHLVDRSDAVLAEDGWPWPWNDSYITEYVYSWRSGALWGQSTGEWFLINRFSPSFGEEPDDRTPPVYGGRPVFPNMEGKRIQRGKSRTTTAAIQGQK